MKSVNLSELNDEELLAKEKQQKSTRNLFRIVVGLLFVIQIYLIVKNGFTLSIVTPLGFIPLLIIMEKNYNDLQKEIQSRKT